MPWSVSIVRTKAGSSWYCSRTAMYLFKNVFLKTANLLLDKWIVILTDSNSTASSSLSIALKILQRSLTKVLTKFGNDITGPPTCLARVLME